MMRAGQKILNRSGTALLCKLCIVYFFFSSMVWLLKHLKSARGRIDRKLKQELEEIGTGVLNEEDYEIVATRRPILEKAEQDTALWNEKMLFGLAGDDKYIALFNLATS